MLRPRESFTARRLARRLGRERIQGLAQEPPPRPAGGKFELTHSCNLRCGFCYTDSPRRTLERATDLSDERWLAIVDEAIELGVLEAVVTGGEPLLRRDLVLEIIRRFDSAGIGTTLNTNGWFVDEPIAAEIGASSGVHVHVSIDGASAREHDAARGVPGSWRRAVRAVHLLTESGAPVHVVHVVTPENAGSFPEFLDAMWELGLTHLRVTPVVEMGAAARRRGWRVDRGSLRRHVDEFCRRRSGLEITLHAGDAGGLVDRDYLAPVGFLVRPKGAVLIDSQQPFSFGNAVRDGLAECWRRIAERWRDPRISAWAGSIRGPDDVRNSEVIPYVDDEVVIAGHGPEGEEEVDGDGKGLDAAVPAPVDPAAAGDPELLDPGRARAHLRSLALSRRYRLGEVRLGGVPEERWVRRLADGRLSRLNTAASLVLDSLDGGTPAEAVRALSARFPGEAEKRLEDDAIGAARELSRRGVVVPAAALKAPDVGAGSTPDLPGERPGEAPSLSPGRWAS